MIQAIASASLGRVTQNLHSFYQLRLNRIHKFKPKIEIHSDVGPFLIKTVTTVEELRQALALRWEVFHHEMLGRKANGIDVDEFDFNCDHLIVKEKRTDQVVGTYRLNCSLFTDEFYSAKEFLLQHILKHSGVKLELGRACIHKDYRRGVLISVLWKGIAEYMSATEATLLFGCATVKTEDPRNAALLTRYFEEQGRIIKDFRTRPTLAFTMPLLNHFTQELGPSLSAAQVDSAEQQIPSLCRAYLKAGAYIGGEPAWDRNYECIDFLTIMKREDLNRTLWKKYKLDSLVPTQT